jgi:ABC-type Mn2+/Zn2+ transport system permease subunit
MRPSETFGMMARPLGLLLVLSSLATLFHALSDLALGGLGIGVIAWVNFGMPSLVAGLWLLVVFQFFASSSRRPRRRLIARSARMF